MVIVQYRAPVAYPSKAVLRFYQDNLRSRGWAPIPDYPDSGSTAQWSDLTAWGRAAGEGELQMVVVGQELSETWQNVRLNLSLQLWVSATPGSAYQDVTVNVFPSADGVIPP